MPQGKHAARHRLERTRRTPQARLALVAAPLATVSVVGAGVAVSTLPTSGERPAASAARAGSNAAPAATTGLLSAAAGRSLSSAAVTGALRSVSISRDLDRLAVPEVTDRLWTTANLDLRLAPGAHARTDGEFAAGKRIAVTGERVGDYAQVVVDRQVRWVTASYLSEDKPADPGSMPLAGAPCAGTSAVMSGLVAAADRVYTAVCNNFPQITTYGGLDAHGEHSTGRAIDIMTSDVRLGTSIAEFLRANASALGIYDIIWRQRIWTPVRASEGWRFMPDRGSSTANHYDHVHVSVY